MSAAVARPRWQAYDLKVLFTREQIAQKVAEMGAAITRDYQGEAVILIGVLKGATIFLSDLARNIELETTFDFLGTSAYGNGTSHSGEVRLTKDLDESVAGKNVILVEDILDTGLTLSYLKKVIAAHKPKSLRVAALLDKPSRRKLPMRGDYVGFEIPNEFVVGYGMDYCERYRNLPEIGVLPPEAYTE
jgi:hypoxanthine phosphoribosyltransferase